LTVALDIVLPMFGLMLCGYVSARLGLFRGEAVRGLSIFVFVFAIPALLFRGITGGTPSGGDQLTIVYAYFLGCLLIFGASMLVGRLVFRLGLQEQAVMAFTTTFSNTVLLGIPLIYAAFGPAGILPVTLITSLHSIILLTLATTIVEFGKGAGRHFLHTLPKTLLALLRNPLLLAIIAGYVVRFLGWPVPVVLDRGAELLAGAAAPCSLFALGATLTTFRIGGDAAQSVFLVVTKMLIHPLVVWLLARYVFTLAPLQIAVATILAALPAGANAFILAERYGVYLERTATCVLVTTALSVVTVTLLLTHYAPAP
jgi:malonate transporter